jgi:acyl carrier protein
MSSVKDQIIAVINDVCAPNSPDLKDGSKSLLECGLDSLDLASVIMALEEKFNRSVDSGEVESLINLDAIDAYFSKKA